MPELGTGQSLATSAGVPTPITVSVLSEQNAVSVTGDGWGINMNIPAVSGTVQDDNGQPVIRLIQSSMASMSGSGMQPGTIASVWFFSEPTLMGTVAVAEDGSFTLDVMVDAQFIPAGNHTVQVQGVGTDGYIKSVNMGVLVEEPPAPTTASDASVMLWWVVGAFMVALLLLVIVVVARWKRSS